jgi:hypothetical protein
MNFYDEYDKLMKQLLALQLRRPTMLEFNVQQDEEEKRAKVLDDFEKYTSQHPGPKRVPDYEKGGTAPADAPRSKPYFDPQTRPEVDNWKHRSTGMLCKTCMHYVPKADGSKGRCRRHAPTMSGFPVMFPTDWCGDHKLA